MCATVCCSRSRPFPSAVRPVELQCYTSLSSVFILVPATLALVDFRKVWEHTSWSCLGTLALGGISFHCQSFTEYILLGYISPVTHR